ncbi:MAG: NADP-dependent glyceraldehyde-3-phosphate dehydrogenase [Planctomycetota bacterium]|nr:NADP-dependent glyceraldehyde-3-phosphate dehydrogenase [Planctomycetota bacterium]
MPSTDVRARIKNLFPKIFEVPGTHDFAPGGGLYEKGDLYLLDGEVKRWAGATAPVTSPVCVSEKDGPAAPRLIGRAATLTAEEAARAMQAAVRAYDRGRGKWPQMKVAERIHCVEHFAELMEGTREEVVRLLMWEIGKTRKDSEKEFDRTVEYIRDTIEALKDVDRQAGRFSMHSGILAQIRRSPLGVTLCMGPYNYPLNETFTTLVPALIMGNTVICKLPRFGVLCSAPLLRCFASAFPAGVVNIVNGDGATVVTPAIASEHLAALAFIGSAKVANILKRQHPMPNRLRCILGLNAKNPGIVLPDADVGLAVEHCVTGALSYNGQRCTALKLLFVHRSRAEEFVAALAEAVDKLPFGLPWEEGVKITPLPEPNKSEYLAELLADAKKGGAKVCNKYGGLSNLTFFYPAVAYPVTPKMRMYHEEQFGPVIPVAVYDDVNEVLDYVTLAPFGQQASVFGNDPKTIGSVVDVLANEVSRVNINAQCQRGPDVYPFTGRKDSAEGTLSVSDALRCFSIRSMIAAPNSEANTELMQEILLRRTSNFINTDYIF